MRRAEVSQQARELARRLAKKPPYAWARILVDLVAWAALAIVALHVHPVFVAPIAFVIGFVFMHDLLIHGHEAVHRLAARPVIANEVLLFFLHALFGISGTAHRAFHLAHHRWPHGPRDPEYQILSRLGGARGWSYLVLPTIAPLGVYLWIFGEKQRPGVRLRVVLETIAFSAMHAAFALGFGPWAWIVCFFLPIALGLLPAFALRAIGEHHGKIADDPWKYAGTLSGGALGRLWSNIDHHLEHHLFPRVPTRYMPELRAALKSDYEREGIVVGPGWLKTFVTLFGREHFG